MRHIDRARELIGAPWVHQGRSINGVDCVGLGLYAFEETHDEPYSRDPTGTLLEDNIEEYMGPPVDDEPRFGDVVSLAWGKNSRHAGLIGEYNGRLTIIHACAIQGRVLEVSFDDKWRKRVSKVYRRAE